jgi:hypothetical protein
MRKSRSSRKLPALASSCSSALVAESRRTSTRRVCDEPTRSSSPVSKHAQQLGLLAQGDVGDLVEKERAAVGQLEAADAIGARVGECAFDVAEDFALEGSLGQAAGVDGDQRHARAGRGGVQQLGDDLLAGAVLAGDEHVGVGGADLRDQFEHRLHGGRAGT